MEQELKKTSIELLNSLDENGIKDLVRTSEEEYHAEVSKTVDEVVARKGQIDLVMISGPTGSAKTSTAGLVAAELTARGVQNVTLNLDDFYLDRNQMEVLEDGSLDLESVECLDLGLIKRCFFNLLNYHKAILPIFDFKTGRRSETARHAKLQPGGLLVVEGIHALNPRIADENYGARALKVFISPLQEYTFENETIIGTNDIRLLRRLPRDSVGRDSNPDKVFRIWKNVMKSEPTKVLPFKDTADILLDSSFRYELMLYAQYVLPMLVESVDNSFYAVKMQELITKLELCYNRMDISLVPEKSVMNEFIMM